MLQNIFRYVLGSKIPKNTFVKNISICSTNFCTYNNDQIIRHQPSQDEIINEVKLTKDTLEVLDIVADHSTAHLTTNQIITCLRSIFNHQKHDGSVIKSSDVLKHAAFEHLCRNLKQNARNLTLNDTIDALKILTYLGVQPNSRILTSLLSLIRYQINDVTLGHLVFLDILLRKMEKTPLVEALSIAIPLIFQVHLPLKLDHENIRELNDCLAFATRNYVSEKCKTSIVTALKLHGDSLSIQEASNILRLMCDLRPYDPNYEKLIQNCFLALNKNFKELYFSTIDSILTKVVERYNYQDTVFYNEEFMTKCGEFIVRNNLDIKSAFYVLKKFNRIAFVHFELLNYILGKLSQDGKFLENVSPGYIFTLVGALSTANYKPPEWEKLKEHILLNSVFQNERVDLPWMKFTLDLLVLDVWCPKLVEKIFQPEFLRQYFARENNKLDHALLLILYQVIKTIKESEYNGPTPGKKYLMKAEEISATEDHLLDASLNYIYSNFSILSNSKTRLGHTIEHVVILDQGNHPAEPTPASEISLEERVHPETVEDLLEKGYKVLAVCRPSKSKYTINLDRMKGIFELKYKTIEHILPVVIVSGRIWKDLHENEKIPYLEQIIKERLDKFDHKSV